MISPVAMPTSRDPLDRGPARHRSGRAPTAHGPTPRRRLVARRWRLFVQIREQHGGAPSLSSSTDCSPIAAAPSADAQSPGHAVSQAAAAERGRALPQVFCGVGMQSPRPRSGRYRAHDLLAFGTPSGRDGPWSARSWRRRAQPAAARVGATGLPTAAATSSNGSERGSRAGAAPPPATTDTRPSSGVIVLHLAPAAATDPGDAPSLPAEASRQSLDARSSRDAATTAEAGDP
jgi:hypothetical protein